MVMMIEDLEMVDWGPVQMDQGSEPKAVELWME
jgi:hypothetical protein